MTRIYTEIKQNVGQQSQAHRLFNWYTATPKPEQNIETTISTKYTESTQNTECYQHDNPSFNRIIPDNCQYDVQINAQSYGNNMAFRNISHV